MKKESASNTFEIVVTGESMWPVLVPGKHYTARRDLEPKTGDVVVATNPRDASQTIVKRVTAIQENRQPKTVQRKTKRFSVNGSRFPAYTLSGTVSWSSSFEVTRPQILGVIDFSG
jgi:hypothetical protein